LKLSSGLLVRGCAVGTQAAGSCSLEGFTGADTRDVGAVKKAGSETESNVIDKDTVLRGAGAVRLCDG
jgi:hypothetical protein